jgi:outer membrane murein-binding lipoprotein Lpp
MRTGGSGLGVTIAVAVVALSACQYPTMDQYNSLSSEVADLRARLDAREATANQAAASAAECRQMCERTDRMFQQSQRK